MSNMSTRILEFVFPTLRFEQSLSLLRFEVLASVSVKVTVF